MSTETVNERRAGAARVPIEEDRSFADVLRSLIGQTVTIANPESFEHAPVGRQIKAGYYRGKPVAMGRDYLTVVTEMAQGGKSSAKEPVKQFIPLAQIKRVSIRKTERILHL